MMKFLFLVSFLILSQFSVRSQYDSALVRESLHSHVRFLASDSLKGRAAGSHEESLANAYINSQFKHKICSRDYSWTFDIPMEKDTIQSTMIGTYINNHSDSTLLIGAHVDHLGFGGKFSLAPGSAEIHNGADDNASGVSVLIELQKALSKQKSPYNILLVPYTAHEIGTFGSEYLASHLPKNIKPIRLVLNLDMVGRMELIDPKIWVSTYEIDSNRFYSTPHSFAIQNSAANKLPILDTKHFYKDSIPCITITTGMHNDYHKPTDDAAFINVDGMMALYSFLLQWITTKPD